MADQAGAMFEHRIFGWRRRAVLAAFMGAGSAVVSNVQRQAKAATGIDALDTPALKIKSPANVFLVAVCLAGSRLIAVGAHGVIVYSDDSGTSWSQADVPVSVTLTCVAFASPMVGWAAGHFGVILNTVDGGKTWQSQLNGIQANQLALTAAQDPSLQGSTWPAAPVALRRANVFVANGPELPFLTLLVAGPQHVIAFGAYRMACVTMDGGKSWVDWSLHIGDKFSYNLYSVALVGSDLCLVGEQGLVFYSTDGGNFFAQVSSPSGVTLDGVLSARDGSIIVFGVAGTGFRSVDGGKSWTSINLNTQDTLTAGRVLQSGSIVIAGEAGALFSSKDNGATFTQVSGMPTISIFDFVQAPNSSYIFVGDSGITQVAASTLNI